MTTTTVAPLRQRLVEYSQGRITDAALWRALFTHIDWLVPVAELAHYRPSGDGEVVLPGRAYLFDDEGSVADPRYLFLFTDPAPAVLVRPRNIRLGMFTGGMSGVEVFGKVSPKWEGVMVNPGSPQEETWFIPHESFAALAAFAERFLLEEEFTRLAKMPPSQARSPEEVSKLVKRLRAFREFEVPVWEDTRMPLSTTDGETPAEKMVVCTWADCVEAIKATLPPDQQARVKKMLLDGTTLFQSGESLGFAMVVINPRGPGSGLELRLGDGSGPGEIWNVWPPD